MTVPRHGSNARCHPTTPGSNRDPDTGSVQRDTDRDWILCSRGHEIRVLPLNGDVLLQVRVNGEPTTTSILGPAAQLTLLAQLSQSKPS